MTKYLLAIKIVGRPVMLQNEMSYCRTLRIYGRMVVTGESEVRSSGYICLNIEMR